MTIDARHSLLFDIAFEQLDLDRRSPGERKRQANDVANRLVSALQSESPMRSLEQLQAQLAKTVGDRGAERLVTAAGKLITTPEARASRGATGHLKLAVLTGHSTDGEARELTSTLRVAGAEVFFYRDIPAGRRSRKAIEEGIMTSDYVVLLVTKEALASNEVDYERDVLHHLEMQDRRERVIAVVVDDMRFRDLPPDLGIVTALRWADGGARQVHRGIVARARDDQSRRGTRNGGKKRPS